MVGSHRRRESHYGTSFNDCIGQGILRLFVQLASSFTDQHYSDPIHAEEMLLGQGSGDRRHEKANQHQDTRRPMTMCIIG